MKKSINLEKFYHHPIDKIWRAISDEQAISAWFIQANFKPEVGYQYKFTHEDTVVSGEVLQANPPNILVYTWRVDNMEVSTTVTWQLIAQDGGTMLELTHEGFENFKDSAADMFTMSAAGWETVVEELLAYLEAN